MIPKIIHQTYSTDRLPADIFKIVNDLKSLNPDWDYRFYTDHEIENYIKKNFDQKVLKAYLSINPVYGAAKADLFRYLVIYNEGGIYLDIKSTCIYPLSKIIHEDDSFIVTQWQNQVGQVNCGAGLYKSLTKTLNIEYGEYQQWVIVAEKKSPIMLAVIEKVVNNILKYRPWDYKFNSYGKKGVIYITGPIAYTQAIYSVEHLYSIRFERYDKNLGFLYNALKNQCHTNVLSKHYSKCKSYIVNQGFLLNSVFFLYILMIRLIKNLSFQKIE